MLAQVVLTQPGLTQSTANLPHMILSFMYKLNILDYSFCSSSPGHLIHNKFSNWLLIRDRNTRIPLYTNLFIN